MQTRILWQTTLPSIEKTKKDFGIEDNSLEDPSEAMLAGIKRVAREDTEIVWNPVKRSSYTLTAAYLEMLNNVAVLEEVIAAEEQGYDAVVICCGNDPALKEARQAVEIPVVVPGEASMLLACTLGAKFGIVGVDHAQVSLMEECVRRYGLTDRAVLPARYMAFGDNLNDELAAVVNRPETVNPRFEDAARACIEDGADVIISACTGISSALTQIGYHEVPGAGVPVIDSTHAALKLAETLADLKRTIGLGKSQHGPYKSVPKEVRDQMRALASTND